MYFICVYIYILLCFVFSLIMSIIIFVGNCCIPSFNEFVRFSLYICFSICLDFISIFHEIPITIFIIIYDVFCMLLRFCICVLFLPIIIITFCHFAFDVLRVGMNLCDLFIFIPFSVIQWKLNLIRIFFFYLVFVCYHFAYFHV